MEFITLLVGFFLIVLGFAVKAAPNLIAGYNTLSEDQKKKIDIKGLSIFMRNGLILIGLILIGAYYLFIWLGIREIADLLIIPIPFLGAIILMKKAQKYNPN